ncbi:PDDEXK nuclease domain-containing protein [Niabella drilacis]|uniref:Predicted nuclease of restriction endonuclease-like (RecB) superfamily, DUF1016 family n=1 Tax=Niabella drilacis (strain DSM 25811 / CCM 8410 / CCUG 62505 / LMG 26954 / E90) TaxID=1285928 RepID=A0A1G6NTY1_NIADE|nr:PDDEXK nuclease domain-containing protein [Niabella drilacis]SDC70794.1 Predicted nuclease of restriction endonuclease-like (RecB) superfamily, DUF1016 family [Niabella drilacis]
MKAITRPYKKWLGTLKEEIAQSRLQTALTVNKNMLLLYWFLGRQIIEKIDGEDWGAKVIDQLSVDLQSGFPDMRGFSVRNLLYMKQFAAVYPDLLITQQPVAQLRTSRSSGRAAAKKTVKKEKKSLIPEFTQQPVAQFDGVSYFLSNPLLIGIPWGHHTYLIDKISNEQERLWYIQKTVAHNWSRALLQYQLSTDLYLRQHKRKKTSNFHLTLPKPQADLANQILKDPYIFRFPQISEFATERQLEEHLLLHIRDFLLELGAGFAFVGRQVILKGTKKDYFADLLFYHLLLRCFVVIDLKMESFELEHTGKMNGYLNIVNKQFKQESDRPSIGIILCGSKDNMEVDFALAGINQPIGVCEYTFSKALPRTLKNRLPTAKQLQDEVKVFYKKLNTGK